MNKIRLWLIFISLTIYSVSACSDGCYDCDNSTNTCIACSDIYQRTAQGNCIKPTITNCILFGNTNLCYKCKPSFKLLSNQCIKQFSGCVRYSTANKCMECGFGLILNNDTCLGVLNCNQTDSNNKCTLCNDGYTLVNNLCKSSMNTCSDIDQQTEACKKCNDGNTLSGYKCVAQYIDPQFCYVYDGNGQCIYCKQGFTSLQGVCYTSSQIQKIYAGQIIKARRILKSSSSASNSTTTSTSNNSAVNSSNSQSNSSNVKKPLNPIDRCSKYDDSLTKCVQCQNLYALVNQTCYYGIEGCITYQVVGKTIKCKECSDKYELQPTTSICLQKQQQAVKNCFIPSLNKLSCIVCNQGFIQENGQCVSQNANTTSSIERINCETFDQTTNKCKACVSTNFKIENGLCLDLNCNKFNSTILNQCSQCKQYFQLNSAKGLCEYKDPNCQQVLQQHCAQCTKGYFITDLGYCALTPYGCEIPNPKTNQCSICQSNFLLLVNGTCRQQIIIENCQTLQTNQNSINKCAVCINGFYPSYDVCKKVSQRCNGYDKDTGSCIACIASYILSKGKCLDSNCIKQSVSTIDGCDTCKDGFAFKNGMCRFDDVNCQIILNNTCSSCFDGYIFSIIKGKCILNSSQSNSTSDETSQPNSSLENNKTINSNINQSNTNTQSNPNKTVNQSSQSGVNNSKPTSTVVNNNSQSLPQNSTQSSNSTQSNSAPTDNKIQNCNYQNPINPKICLQCKKQFTLSTDYSTCVSTPSAPSTSIQKDPNCQSYNLSVQRQCLKCNDRFYLSNLTNKCTQVNQLCNTYHNLTGACLTCFQGFEIQAGRCYLKVQIDPYCIQRALSGCSKCIDGYFIDQTKGYTCQKLSELCLDWNYSTGQCISCKDGYSLVNGECINLVDDPNCISFYTIDKKNCRKCVDSYFVNQMTGKCQKINDNCKTYNAATGECYTCKDGYKLSKGLCEKTVSLQTYIKDYYCRTIDKNICTECYNGYYLNLQNVCRQKNPICKQINRQNGDCTKCYQGYYLVSGACVLPSNLYVNAMSFNKNCKKFLSQQVDSCQECYPGYRLAGGVCFEMNQLCKSVDTKSGLCTTCYDGYYLQGGNCLINIANNPNELDPYCTQLSKDFSICVKCAPGYFVGDDGYCKAFNPSYQCQNYSPTTGKCITCYYGYILTIQKVCIQEVQYCTQYNNQSICVECATGFYVKENQCFPRDIKCDIYDSKSGSCNKCIAGYILLDNECIYPTFGADRFCTKYVNSYCTQCAEGSYIFNYRCRQVDTNCSKFDYQNKKCLQCKSGLKPRGISCVSQN